jgi:hypothetical protein
LQILRLTELRGPEDWPAWSAQVIEQARIAQYFELTAEDVVELPEPYDLAPPIESTEAQIEADHTKMTVYMHRLNLQETCEKKVDSLTTFMKQTLDEKILLISHLLYANKIKLITALGQS